MQIQIQYKDYIAGHAGQIGRFNLPVKTLNRDGEFWAFKKTDDVVLAAKEERFAGTYNAAPLTKMAYQELKERKDLDGVQTDTDRNGLFKMWAGWRAAVLSPKNSLAITLQGFKTRFRTRWIICSGLLASLHVSFDRATGRFEFDPEFKFQYNDLKAAWWFKFACNNRDAVNGAALGARMKGTVPSDNEIVLWIWAMGIKLKAQIAKENFCLQTPTSISLKEEKAGSVDKKSVDKKRKSVRFYIVDQISMQPLFDIFKRRWENETLPICAWLESNIIIQKDNITQVGNAKKITQHRGDDTETVYKNMDEWLYPNYCNYCEIHGLKAVSSVRFSKLLVETCTDKSTLDLEFVKKTKIRGTRNAITGLKIRTDGNNLPSPLDHKFSTGLAHSPRV